MLEQHRHFIAPSYTEFLPKCDAHIYFRSKCRRGKPLNTSKDAMEFVNSFEQIVRGFFRNKNGTYRRFWDLTYRNRDYFFKMCHDFKVSRITVLAELCKRLSEFGEERNKEY